MRLRGGWLALCAVLLGTACYFAGQASTLTGSLLGGGRGSRARVVVRQGLHAGVSVHPQHLAVAVAVANPATHVSEFLGYLLPSWEYITSLPAARHRVVDLLVFCEAEACAQLPPHCLPMVDRNGSLFPHDSVPNCWRHQQPPRYAEDWRDYLFMTSVVFAAEPPFTEVAVRYDLILRTDQDAFLTPKLLTWQPPLGMAFGWFSHTFGIKFTENRLKEVAARAGYVHRGMHEICSGWLAPANYTIAFAQHTAKIARYMLDNEFGPDKPGLEQWGPEGKWSEWFRGVTSLYAAEIAINHLVPGINASYSSGHEIDEPTYSDSPISRHVHLHCIHGENEFNKHKFPGKKARERGLPREARLRNATALALITPDMPARDYAAAIAWRAFHSGMATVNRRAAH